MSGEANRRLATYGTLAPGRANHDQLSGLAGAWREGVIRGRRVAQGWGDALGYPGLILDSAGDAVAVDVFESVDLPTHWKRLDAFEGDGYRRVVARVETHEGDIDACVYVIAA